MGLDIVHDTQETYRKLINSMSRPGSIFALKGEFDTSIPLHYPTFLTVLTLLDGEVTFHVVGEENNLGKIIADYTLARISSVEEADYIIVPNETEEEDILKAMETCKIGTLMDPEHSATWIIEQDVISQKGTLTLTGPGIKNETMLHLDVDDAFWKMRNEKVKEFPLGIDLIFTDHLSLTCIPRTTKIMVGGVM